MSVLCQHGFPIIPLKMAFYCVTKRTYRRLDDTPVLLCTLYGSYPISDCCDTVLWVATIRRSVFCSVATVFCKNCGNYSLIYLKSQYYFINCSFFFLSCFFTSGQVLAAFSARIPFFKKRVSLRDSPPAAEGVNSFRRADRRNMCTAIPKQKNML